MALQPPVGKANQEKNGFGESSKAAVCQESNRRSEVVVRQKSRRPNGAMWRAVAVVARPRADSPENQREGAGGRNQRQPPARGTVCEAAASPELLREDPPKDQHKAAGGRRLQRQGS